MTTVRIAILDLYAGQANEGMRCIRAIISQWAQDKGIAAVCTEFEVRDKQELPGLDFDIYISSGGPGSPLESEGSTWERRYFDWIKTIDTWNETTSEAPKPVLFICHSFQLACRYYGIATVCKRKSTAFGIFPIHLLEAGEQEPLFNNMSNPLYAVDSRDFQVIQPNETVLAKLHARVLAIEKERPHVPYERAVMAVRFTEHNIGTQFHPEADAAGMSRYLLREDRKQMVIANYGEAKWQSMIDQLNDPDKISYTHHHVLPNFLEMAFAATQRLPVLS
ncbi:GMP synthase [Deminuibacter soli]|uniref:GMP synthase n=2 Tax=Deminuibacter soli TaxID=2291815 RepID=A0A3E1NJ44_9BACT|nr:GMP synthase [Deminuibacter soli]